MALDFFSDLIGTLALIWAFWGVVAYAARKPFSDLYRDPILWILNITGALFGIWVWS